MNTLHTWLTMLKHSFLSKNDKIWAYLYCTNFGREKMQCTYHTVPTFYKLAEADLHNMSPHSSTLHVLHSSNLHNVQIIYIYCNCSYLWQWNLTHHCGHNLNKISHFSPSEYWPKYLCLHKQLSYHFQVLLFMFTQHFSNCNQLLYCGLKKEWKLLRSSINFSQNKVIMIWTAIISETNIYQHSSHATCLLMSCDNMSICYREQQTQGA